MTSPACARQLAMASLGALLLAHPGSPACAGAQRPATGAAATASGPATTAHREPLAATDTVVLAGFKNDTGDALFDDTLRQALALELEESPFVNVLGDRQVATALQAIGQSSGHSLTTDVGRRVCSQTRSKAVLQGAIARQGSRYRLDLVAADCATGTVLAHARSEASGSAGVLGALSQAASSLRIELGEPAASVQKFRAPVGTTTAALEALKSYSLALAIQRDHGDDPSIPVFRRAIQLDPQLAVAYASLSAAYRNLRQPSLALQFATQGYGLRNRAGGREAFRIATIYYLATGQLDQEMRAYRQWSAAYPRDFLPRNDLGNDYAAIGRNDEALVEYQAGLRLQPSLIGYTNVAGMQVTLFQLDDAKATLEEAITRHFDGLYIRQNLYWLGFLQRDDALMRQQLDWAAGKPGQEDALLTEESDSEAYHGRLRSARAVSQRAVASAIHAGSKETAALWQVNAALRDAEAGNADTARQEAAQALALSSGKDVTTFAALTLARSGEAAQAQALVRKLESQYPTNALLERYWLPTIEAAIALDAGHASRAITALQAVAPNELGNGGTFIAYLYPAYMRGQAYLHERDGKAAVTEFRKLVDHPGIVINFITGSLEYLELGRAYAMAGEPVHARAAYREFFARWSGADADVPVLQQAKKEYAQLG
ncbi:MAG TPA: hypothetical protein VFW10_19240 [Steroidobacteraceae bacterium]|nr:hypothetical protein [Steroidobacteraceae bacterium]